MVFNYILCFTNCVESDPSDPVTKDLFEKYPYANVYSQRNGGKGKKGTIEIKGNGRNHPFIICANAQYYEGTKSFPADTPKTRKNWFKDCIDSLKTLCQSGQTVRIGLTQNFYKNLLPDDEEYCIECINEFVKVQKQGKKYYDFVYTNDNYDDDAEKMESEDELEPSDGAKPAELVNLNELTQISCENIVKPVSKYKANPDWFFNLNELPIDDSWNQIMLDSIIRAEIEKVNNHLQDDLKNIGDTVPILPPQSLVFNAFNLCKFNNIKVVILGQDPYFSNVNEAMGLSFSVQQGVAVPPSLRNIFNEVKSDCDVWQSHKGKMINGDLTTWAQQGVLLLNTSLTVHHGKKEVHLKVWKQFSDRLIKLISNNSSKGIVFLLWGKKAEDFKTNIDEKKHRILITSHPSPMSVKNGFDGCRHFTKTNIMLKDLGRSQIKWDTVNPYVSSN